MEALLDVIAHIPLTAESAAIRWIHEQVASGADVPLAEAAVVVNSLALAMHQDQRAVLPLIDISAHEQYATAHASNVATLAIALSEQMGLSPGDARAIGMAGLVHDIGNACVPPTLLVKPGRLTDEERAQVEAHTVEGARILSTRGRGNALAATVAYEHHRWENGEGGYPHFQWPRRCHFASRLVRVCDIYDAMRSPRPYRRALSQADAVRHLQERSGIEVQGEIVQALVELLAHTPEARTPMEETSALAVG
jgi:putative nucleotidyltransferase with HDIG domain